MPRQGVLAPHRPPAHLDEGLVSLRAGVGWSRVRILLIGDCHGRLDLVARLIVVARDRLGIEAAIQVGDFGFFPRVLENFAHEQEGRFALPTYVIDGNHEDHRWLHAQIGSGAVDAWAQRNLYFCPRGTVREIGGRRFGFLGGAAHADRRQEWAGQWTDGARAGRRVPLNPAWATWVTEGDIERAATAFTTRPPEVLVTHSCPADVGVGMVGADFLEESVERFVRGAGLNPGPHHDCGEGALTVLWDRLDRRPPLWLFGHFHRVHEVTVERTRFVCVGSADGSDGAAAVRPIVLETSDLSLTIGKAPVELSDPWTALEEAMRRQRWLSEEWLHDQVVARAPRVWVRLVAEVLAAVPRTERAGKRLLRKRDVRACIEWLRRSVP